MKKLLFAVLFMTCVAGKSFCQSSDLLDSASSVKAFQEYLVKNMRYPAVARENDVVGQVLVVIMVGDDKSISDIKMLKTFANSVSLEKELFRCIKSFKGVLNVKPGEYIGSVSFEITDGDGKDSHLFDKMKIPPSPYKSFLFENGVVGFQTMQKHYIVN